MSPIVAPVWATNVTLNGSGQQLARVEDAGRVQLLLDGAERRDAHVAKLGLHVVAMRSADRVVMGDRRSRPHDGIVGGTLRRAPLLDLVSLIGRCEHGEVERRAGLVQVRDVTADESPAKRAV